MSSVLIKTAFSSHIFCFICKRKANNTNLYQVKQDSQIEAYEKYKIYIKRHARTCARHLDTNGNIREDQYRLIQTKLIYHKLEIQTMLKLMVLNKNSKSRFFFGGFKDFESMDENPC